MQHLEFASLEAALKAYEIRFGTVFMLYVGDCKTDQELIQEIQSCILTRKQQRKPRNRKGLVY